MVAMYFTLSKRYLACGMSGVLSHANEIGA